MVFSVDVPGIMLIGPAGGIGTTPLQTRTMAIVAVRGRRRPEALLPVGWRDLEHLQEGMDAFASKLGAIGLRLTHRKTGLRVIKERV